MYLEHFGLQQPVSDGTIARQAGVFLGPRHQSLVEQLRLALVAPDAIVVLTGQHGVGKTTLCHAALDASGTRQALAWLGEGSIQGSDLIELLLAEFGLTGQRLTRVERLQLWRQFLGEMKTTDSRVYVIVEHADAVDSRALRMLESLTSIDPSGSPGASLILLGTPDLLEQLASTPLTALKQRVRCNSRLEPMDQDESRLYWAHKVEQAGGSAQTLFGDDAVDALHRYGCGLPRLMNLICEVALAQAAVGNEAQLTAARIRQVARDLSVAAGHRSASTVDGPGKADDTRAQLPVLTDAIDANTSAVPTQGEAEVDALLGSGRVA